MDLLTLLYEKIFITTDGPLLWGIVKLISSAGLTFIVTKSWLFKFRERIKIEFFRELLTCPMCFGWWAGLIVFLLPLNVFDFAFISSLASYLIIKNIKFD